MFKIIRKIIKLGAQSEANLEVTELWSVRWYRRDGEYSHNTEKCCEFFTSEDDAKIFKQRLDDAFKLLRYSSGTNVELRKE